MILGKESQKEAYSLKCTLLSIHKKPGYKIAYGPLFNPYQDKRMEIAPDPSVRKNSK